MTASVLGLLLIAGLLVLCGASGFVGNIDGLSGPVKLFGVGLPGTGQGALKDALTLLGYT